MQGTIQSQRALRTMRTMRTLRILTFGAFLVLILAACGTSGSGVTTARATLQVDVCSALVPEAVEAERACTPLTLEYRVP